MNSFLVELSVNKYVKLYPTNATLINKNLKTFSFAIEFIRPKCHMNMGHLVLGVTTSKFTIAEDERGLLWNFKLLLESLSHFIPN